MPKVAISGQGQLALTGGQACGTVARGGGVDLEDWPLARRGDEDAFERIYLRHHRAIYSFAASRSRDLNLAEEVCAEAFTALWRQRASVELHQEGGLLPWLFTVSRRLVTRMSQPHLADIDDLPDDIADFDPVGDAIATQDFVLRVQAAILAMPEDYQNVAIALFRDGLNSTQAGDRLGISPATVRTRLRWLRGALMSQLATDEITNEEAGHDRP